MITQREFTARRLRDDENIFDEHDPRAYGPDGIVRDGVRLRCRMTAMDAKLPIERRDQHRCRSRRAWRASSHSKISSR
jgi:hypothetical protein